MFIHGGIYGSSKHISRHCNLSTSLSPLLSLHPPPSLSFSLSIVLIQFDSLHDQPSVLVKNIFISYLKDISSKQNRLTTVFFSSSCVGTVIDSLTCCCNLVSVSYRESGNVNIISVFTDRDFINIQTVTTISSKVLLKCLLEQK